MWNCTGPAEGTCRWRWTTCLVLPHGVTRPCRPLLSWAWWSRGLVCSTDNQHIYTCSVCRRSLTDTGSSYMDTLVDYIFLFKQFMCFDFCGH